MHYVPIIILLLTEYFPQKKTKSLQKYFRQEILDKIAEESLYYLVFQDESLEKFQKVRRNNLYK